MCFHKWSKWVTFKSYVYTWQYKECSKCGKRKERTC